MSRISLVVGRVTFPGLAFELGDGHREMRVVCPEGGCNRGGDKRGWKGRWWRLSRHMTDGEIVQTCLLAVLVAMEHEAREKFLVDGVAVFDPHFDLNALIALRAKPESIQERACG